MYGLKENHTIFIYFNYTLIFLKYDEVQGAVRVRRMSATALHPLQLHISATDSTSI